MTIDEKRDLLVQKTLTRLKKNVYSQDINKRTKIESGYGDCSGTVWYWYNKLFNINIGGNTEAQINSKNGERVNLSINNGIPDESKMKKGDLLYFRGSDNSRTEGVGHVEMYIGNGQIFGHGSGVGGTIKNMKDYCISRYKTSSTSKLKNKGLICVKRFLKDDKSSINITSTNLVGITTSNLNMRNTYSKNGEVLDIIPLDKAILILATCSNGWYKIKYNNIEGYVSADYVKIFDYHWSSDSLIKLINNDIIENPEICTKYEEGATKAEFASLINKVLNGSAKAINKQGYHWSYEIIQELYKKGYINDLDYWTDYPDQRITNTPVMGMICNIKGGVLDKYKNRVVDHIGRNYLDSLCDYEIIHTWQSWIDFDNVCSRAKIMKLIDNTFLN